MKLLMQHTHLKPNFQILKIAKNTLTQMALIAYSIPLQTQNDYQGKKENIEAKLGNTKYTTNFLVTINNIKQYPYLTQALPFPVCQKHVLTNWILNLY